jgi:cytidylate kinase
MIITISGMPGAGKTTIAKQLSQKLEMPWYSIGEIRGKMAKEHGMTIDEFNKLGEEEEFTDKDVDEYQAKLGKTEDNFIIDGRLSWHFIPHSFKIFLDVDSEEAAERIFSSQEDRNDEKTYETIDEMKKAIEKRLESDMKRYQKYYNVNYLDRSHYDIVIDTTDKTPVEITEEILAEIDSLDESA